MATTERDALRDDARPFRHPQLDSLAAAVDRARARPASRSGDGGGWATLGFVLDRTGAESMRQRRR
jgi:hypothetical protein